MEELWQKVQQYLGPEQARQYTVSSALRHCEMTADHEIYLQKFSNDFVSDVKTLVTQNLAQTQTDQFTKQLVRDVLHHTMLAKEILATRTDKRECRTLNCSSDYSRM